MMKMTKWIKIQDSYSINCCSQDYQNIRAGSTDAEGSEVIKTQYVGYGFRWISLWFCQIRILICGAYLISGKFFWSRDLQGLLPIKYLLSRINATHQHKRLQINGRIFLISIMIKENFTAAAENLKGFYFSLGKSLNHLICLE